MYLVRSRTPQIQQSAIRHSGSLLRRCLALSLVAFLSGCTGGEGSSDDPGEEDEKTEAITVFSERHELFIEHSFLLKGQPTRFITHVTDIVAMKPRTEGSVTFILQRGDGKPIEQEVPKVARTGIYLPEIAFPEAGEWNVSLRIPNEDGTDVVPLPNRTVYSTQAEIDSAPEPEEVDGVSFLKEQAWKIPFRVEPVKTRRLIERLQLTGQIELVPHGRAEVTPPVAGRLLAPGEGTLPALGDSVAAGQVLGRIQPPLAGSDHLTFLSGRQQIQALRLELTVKANEAEIQAARAQITLKQAERSFARVKELAEQKAKSQREVEAAEFEAETASASLRAAQAQLKLYTEAGEKLQDLPVDLREGFPTVELRAPISGIVVSARGALGEHVQSDNSLFTILNTDQVYLQVQVPESKLSRIAKARGAVFRTPDDPDTYLPVLGDQGGRVVLLGRRVDPATRTLPLVYELPNKERQLPGGLAVDVFVETANIEDALAIPESALVDEDGKPVAFVLLGGETFEKRELQLGIKDREWVQVLSGLEAGERVVTLGAHAVRLSSVSTSIPAHGHGH